MNLSPDPPGSGLCPVVLPERETNADADPRLHPTQNADRFDSEIVYDRDFDYDYFGYKTLERSYLLRVDGCLLYTSPSPRD